MPLNKETDPIIDNMSVDWMPMSYCFDISPHNSFFTSFLIIVTLFCSLLSNLFIHLLSIWFINFYV